MAGGWGVTKSLVAVVVADRFFDPCARRACGGEELVGADLFFDPCARKGCGGGELVGADL